MTIEKEREAARVAEKASEATELSKQLGALLRSPVRVKALVLLLERTASPKEISNELKISLNTASNHVKELRKMKLIELVRTEPRRGTVEHFYCAVMQPIWSKEEWATLSTKERQEYVIWLVQLANCDVAEALLGGTFNSRPDTHSSRTYLLLDEQGRRDLNEIQDEALEACLAVGEASAKRLAENKVNGLPVYAIMLCIDLPEPK